MKNPSSFFVVIPALNEDAAVARIVREVLDYGITEVVVVDDCSVDRTAETAREAGATVISLPERLGAWGATQTGLRYATRRGASHVVTLDADGQHPANEIYKLIEALETTSANVVIGCCRERGTQLRKIAWWSIALVSGLKVGDLTSGFRAYDRDALETLVSWRANLIEYQDVGILLLLQRAGLTLTDVQVQMSPRAEGKSRIFYSWGAVTYYIISTLLLSFSKRKKPKVVTSRRKRHEKRINKL